MSQRCSTNSNAWQVRAGPRFARHHAEVRDGSQRERSHRDLPKNSRRDVDEDLLIAALDAAGLQPTLAAWDDVTQWTGRSSVWPFYARRGTTSITSTQFLAWAVHAGTATNLVQPVEVVHWNTHKGYSRHLAKQGVPVVPTAWLSGWVRLDLADLIADRGWHDVVIAKPSGGCGSLPHRSDHRSTNAGGERLLAATVPKTGKSWLQPCHALGGGLRRAVTDLDRRAADPTRSAEPTTPETPTSRSLDACPSLTRGA